MIHVLPINDLKEHEEVDYAKFAADRRDLAKEWRTQARRWIAHARSVPCLTGQDGLFMARCAANSARFNMRMARHWEFMGK